MNDHSRWLTIKHVRAIVVPDTVPWLSLPATWVEEKEASLPRVINFGQRNIAYVLRKHRGGGERIVISSALQNILLLPLERSLSLYETSRALHIGPYIGLLTIGDTHHLRRLAKAWIREGALEDDCLYATIDARSIDWETLSVLGILFDRKTSEKELIPRRMPLPDMLFNKIPSRQWELRLEQDGFFDRLYELTTAQLLNPSYFKKWDIYQRLMTDPQLNVHIPETIRQPSERDLYHLLKTFGALYLKPEDGYKGKGIYFLQKKGNRYHVSYRSGHKTIAKTFKSIQSFLSTHLPEQKIHAYVAQQAIQLMKFNGRPFDFRAHLVKDGTHTWQMMGLVAKVAGAHSITTHLYAGGHALSAKEALQQQSMFEPETLMNLIKDRAQKIAYRLEDSYRHPLIELGIDLGFAQDGHLYIFEVNAKPGYAIFESVPTLSKNKHAVKRALLSNLAALARQTWNVPNVPIEQTNHAASGDEREANQDVKPSGTDGAPTHYS